MAGMHNRRSNNLYHFHSKHIFTDILARLSDIIVDGSSTVITLVLKNQRELQFLFLKDHYLFKTFIDGTKHFFISHRGWWHSLARRFSDVQKRNGAAWNCWMRSRQSPLCYSADQIRCSTARWKRLPESTGVQREEEHQGLWSHWGRWSGPSGKPESIVHGCEGGWGVQGGGKAKHRSDPWTSNWFWISDASSVIISSASSKR